MYERTTAPSAIPVSYYKHLHVSVTSVTIFKVYGMNIRSTAEVVYDEILQDLVHCNNSMKIV